MVTVPDQHCNQLMKIINHKYLPHKIANNNNATEKDHNDTASMKNGYNNHSNNGMNMNMMYMDVNQHCLSQSNSYWHFSLPWSKPQWFSSTVHNHHHRNKKHKHRHSTKDKYLKELNELITKLRDGISYPKFVQGLFHRPKSFDSSLFIKYEKYVESLFQIADQPYMETNEDK